MGVLGTSWGCWGPRYLLGVPCLVPGVQGPQHEAQGIPDLVAEAALGQDGGDGQTDVSACRDSWGHGGCVWHMGDALGTQLGTWGVIGNTGDNWGHGGHVGDTNEGWGHEGRVGDM